MLLLAAAALAIRLPRLGDRPMHADEAVQAARSRDLWRDASYVYNPDEFHGPLLQYLTLAWLWAEAPESFAETTAATYRIVPVLFAAGLILLVWLLGDALGKPAVAVAGLLVTISPALVYYSRYYIHETLLVFFTLAAVAAGWRYAKSGKLAWCLTAGASLGLMHATKETSVIAYFAMGFGLVVAVAWARVLGENDAGERPATRRWHPRWHLALGLAAAVVVIVVLFSSFFTNLRGPMDAVLTYRPWLGRAGGASPHVHPWYYYLRILGWWRVDGGPLCSEGLILALASVGLIVAFLPRKMLPDGADAAFLRWLGGYTLMMTVAYSAIPYKTPWCLLGFLQGMTLLAGVGAVALVRSVPTLPLKGLVALALCAAAGQLGWQSYRAAYVLSADPKNPYVYAHTLPDVDRLSADLNELTKAIPPDEPTSVNLIWHDPYYWPLPWYLRQCHDVSYWTRMPDDPSAPVVICSPQLDAAVTEKLDDTHLMTGYYGVRPNVLALVWVRMDVWEAHLRRKGRL